MKYFVVILGLVSILWGCTGSSNVYKTPEMENALSRHQRVAVLPFKVTFSEDYKTVLRGREGREPWQEQERRAGIDLQKTTFENLTKRANKKGYNVTVQSFLATNKTLEEAGVSFWDLMSADKAQVAKLLGVDAVVFGTSNMEFDVRRGFGGGFSGMRSGLGLFDAVSGVQVWGAEDMEHISNAFDSPQDLARRSVNDLVSSIPYKSGAKTK